MEEMSSDGSIGGWMKLFLYSIPLIGGVFSTGVYFITKNQEKLLYQPNCFPQWTRPSDNPQGYKNPGEWGMSYATLSIPTRDGLSLLSWFIPSSSSPQSSPTMIFFHGNAGNIGFRLPNLFLLHDNLDINILMVAYRGYSGNQGTPSESGFLIDAEASLDYLLNEMKGSVDPSQIFVFGRSLGGAAALALAASRSNDIAGTIVENTFTSISDLVDSIFPYISFLKYYLLSIEWNNCQRLPQITHPLLFISGKLDTLIPPSHMSRLHSIAVTSPNASSVVEFVLIPSGTHNDTWKIGGRHYLEAIRGFMERALSLKSIQ